MKKETYILFTAGRGPVECSMAVHGIQHQFKKYLDRHEVGYEVITLKKGTEKKTIETIVFRVYSNNGLILDPWIGTLQWICQSPSRKYSKRKNWFIKSEILKKVDTPNFSIKDSIVQTFKSSGPGGQHRNKIETAIRIIHRPTGIIVTACDSKSQGQNKKKAWEKLETELKMRHERNLKNFNADQWTSQINIERGNPRSIFKGANFKYKLGG